MAFTWWNSLGKRTCLGTSGGSGSRKRYVTLLVRVIMHACAVHSYSYMDPAESKNEEALSGLCSYLVDDAL